MWLCWNSHDTLVFSAPRLHVVPNLGKRGQIRLPTRSLIVSTLRRCVADEISNASSHSTHCRVSVMSTIHSLTFPRLLHCHIHKPSQRVSSSSHESSMFLMRSTLESLTVRFRIFLIAHVTFCDAQAGDTLFDCSIQWSPYMSSGLLRQRVLSPRQSQSPFP